MKKVVVIVLLLAVLFAAVSVASAEPETKEEYYQEILDTLGKLQAALLDNNMEEANRLMILLRGLVYRCSLLLMKNGEYNQLLQKVISDAQKACGFMGKDNNAIVKFLTAAGNDAALALFGKPEKDVVVEAHS